MTISYILLFMHLFLFAIKLWAVVLLIENFRKYKFLIAIFIAYLLIQIRFVYCFFLDIDLYYYEIASVLDQCMLTVLLIIYLIKEVGNGKRKN